MTSFKKFDFHPSINESIDAMGFSKPTPVQSKTIPIILENKDLIACAQTGTGKTAAFLLPVLQKITESGDFNGTKLLVVVPTRELALQIDQQVQGFAYFVPVSSVAVYGGGTGDTWDQQKSAIAAGVNIIIATPGRLISLINLDYLKPEKLMTLVLDEADRMLDMGFHEDIIKIINVLPKKRQTLMFSATMPPKIRQLAKKILSDPEEINISIAKPAEGVLQGAYLVHDEQKPALIVDLLRDKPELRSILIFAATKKNVKNLHKQLKAEGFSCDAIHSDLEQQERISVLNDFKNKRLRILVATDIVSRGIDIDSIDLVINYDVPSDAEDYVHRVGRTARAELTGVALTFINSREVKSFMNIEALIGNKVHKLPLPTHLGEGPEYVVSKDYGSRKPYGNRTGKGRKKYGKKTDKKSS
ncbi:MAG: DEAD/DEAH box helicase [Bacteroidales bacterium]